MEAGSVNQKEAAKLAEAVRILKHGPGNGWTRTLEGTDEIGPPRSIEQRVRSVEIWLESWILPAMEKPATRYGRKK
jgi:hypothetical protein